MSDIMTLTVTDETSAGANDGSILIEMNPNFTDYGFQSPIPNQSCNDSAFTSLVDSAGTYWAQNAQGQNTIYNCLGDVGNGLTGNYYGNMPPGDYFVHLGQGVAFPVGNQLLNQGASPCTWNMLSQGFGVVTISAGAQATGCTDSIASNYDANAAVDDGSCVYASGTFLVGDSGLGGIVAYIFQPGDAGYIASEDHGIVVETTSSPNNGNVWGCDFVNVSGLGDAIGDGQNNTATIIAQNCSNTPTVANLADNYTDGTYTDWFLPSINELVQIHNGIGPGATGTNSNNVLNDNIGNFNTFQNWSSSQATPVSSVHVLDFNTGVPSTAGKNSSLAGRYARYF